jgi:Mn-dependent DtxR family transcriptional regulator
MDSQDAQDRYRQQIDRLLGFPGVGALPAGAIASNLGVPPGVIETVLAALQKEGRVVSTGDGRFALPARGRER